MKENLWILKKQEDIRNFEFRTVNDFRNYCKSGKKPNEIPSNPNETYKNDGWISWSDWLGTDNIANQNKQFLSHEEAKKFVHNLNLKSGREWREYCKSGNKPDNIPNAPQSTYKNKGWVSMGDWLGTGIIAPQLRNFFSFNKAREFVRKLQLKSKKEWKEYCKSGKKPDNIPYDVEKVYKNKGWKNWKDWLGKE